MTRLFEVEFRTTGQSDSVRAFEELRLKELQAKQQTAELAAELRRLQRSGEASAEEIESVSRAMIRAQARTQSFGRQAGELSQSITAQNTSLLESRNKWEGFGGVISQVGGVVGRLNPQLAGVGQTISVLGGSVTALTGALGPVAAVMAGVTVAAQLASVAFGESAEEMDSVDESATNAASSLRELARAYAEVNDEQDAMSGLGGEEALAQTIEESDQAAARVQALRAVQLERLSNLVGQRVETADDAIALYRRLNDQNREVGARMEPILSAAVEELSRLSVRANEIRIRQEELRRAVPVAEEASGVEAGGGTGREAEPPPAPRSRRGGGGRRRERVNEEEELQQLILQYQIARVAEEQAEESRNVAVLMDTRRALADWSIEVSEAQANARLAGFEKERTAHAALIAEERRAEQAAFEKQAEDQLAAVERARENQKALAEATTGAVMDVSGSMNNLVGQTIGFLQEGGDLASEAYLGMLDSFLEATAIEYTIRALAETGQAIASFASQDYPAGAQHLAAAGVYAAVAVATGAAGAAISVPSTSQQPQQPQQVQQSTPLANGGGTTNITNLYAPQAIFTESERAEIINSSQRARRRERGAGSARI